MSAFSNGYKVPSVMSEKRAAAALLSDTTISDATGRVLTIRAKRWSRLPNAFDDRKKIDNNNWKQHRRTQYRVVDVNYKEVVSW